MSHLHQTGHPGLILLLSGRRLRRRRQRTPSASLPASPRGRSGRTPPLPIGADCSSSPSARRPARRPRSWALRDPGRAGRTRGRGALVEAMWAGSGSGLTRGRPAALRSRVEGPVPAAHILPGQRLPVVRATWDRWAHRKKRAAPAERVAAAAASGRALVSGRGGLQGR